MGREVIRRYSPFKPTSVQLESSSRHPPSFYHSLYPVVFTPSLLSHNRVDQFGEFHRVFCPTKSQLNHAKVEAKTWAFWVKQCLVLHLIDHWSCPNVPVLELEIVNHDEEAADLDLFQELSSKRCMTSDDFYFVRVGDSGKHTWVEAILFNLWKTHLSSQSLNS